MFHSEHSALTLSALAWVTLVVGCGRESESQPGDRGRAAAPTVESAQASTTGLALTELRLPATFAGAVAMTGDEIREVTLRLRADERFLWRETAIAKDGGTGESDYDRGRWYLAYGGRQLVLIGKTEGPRKFEPEGPERLRALEGGGITGAGRYLARTEDSMPIDGPYAMQGTFQYMADAASFGDCLMGKRFPVAMTGDFLELERAYLSVDHAPGEAIQVSIEGHLEQRPKMEGSGTTENVVVDRFVAILPDGRCKPRAALAELENTYWKLVEVGGMAVEVPEGQREAHLILRPAERRVTGHTGCNQLTGGYSLEDERLEFERLATTRMACAGEPDVERAFMEALESVTRYEIYGERLDLYSGRERVARLEARYMK